MVLQTYRAEDIVMARARRLTAGLVVAAAAFLAISPGSSQERTVTIFAAASLQTALDRVVAAWQAEGRGEAVVSYAATSALARQIEQGAPADLFISADLEWMAYLDERGLLDSNGRTGLLGNRIVLVAPTGVAQPVEITPELDLVAMLSGGRLAVADTEAVPAGRYARASLEALGLWDGIADRLAPAENVRAALALVSRGEAPLGIVYATDDVADAAVEAIGVFPSETHPPIVYPAAILAGKANPSSEAFLEYLRYPTAVCIFQTRGFTVFASDGTVMPMSQTCPAND
jgi:molybdate transport system substrate-binding protein